LKHVNEPINYVEQEPVEIKCDHLGGAYPLVSVIVPSYNHSKYIAQSLQSVVGQTYPNIEIIFIDDGSSDNTFEIGRDVLKTSGRPFIALKKDNEGLVKTLNLALRTYVKGEYITLVASDDWWDATNLEKKVRYLQERKDCGLVYSLAFICDEDGNICKTNDISTCRSGSIYDSLLLVNFIPGLTVMFRAELLETIGCFDEKSKIEDWDMWLRIAKDHRIGLIDEPLGYYRIHGNNASKNIKMMYKNCCYILNKHKISNEYYSAKRNLRYYYIYNKCLNSSVSMSFKYMCSNFGFNRFYAKMIFKYIRFLLFQRGR
jgi:alpha-1,3-rhamnosyltransferase